MTKSDKLLAKLVWEVDTSIHPNDLTSEVRQSISKCEKYLVDKYNLDSGYEIKELVYEQNNS